MILLLAAEYLFNIISYEKDCRIPFLYIFFTHFSNESSILFIQIENIGEKQVTIQCATQNIVYLIY